MRRVLRMAMWRRPPGFEPPAELFEFDPADWPGSDVFTDWPTENPAWEAAFNPTFISFRDRGVKGAFG
jgi:hypothetical protein